MKAKNLVVAALLIFVSASVVILVGRAMRDGKADDTALAVAQLPDNALIVYYLHGDRRCPTCRTIESSAHEAVQAAFGEELGQEKVLWKVVNYEQAENAHFATDYEIVASAVVLVRMVDGRPSEWRNLDRVWEFAGDHDALADYVQSETRSMLGS